MMSNVQCGPYNIFPKSQDFFWYPCRPLTIIFPVCSILECMQFVHPHMMNTRIGRETFNYLMSILAQNPLFYLLHKPLVAVKHKDNGEDRDGNDDGRTWTNNEQWGGNKPEWATVTWNGGLGTTTTTTASRSGGANWWGQWGQWWWWEPGKQHPNCSCDNCLQGRPLLHVFCKGGFFISNINYFHVPPLLCTMEVT